MMINRRDVLLGMAAVAMPLPAELNPCKEYVFPNRPIYPFHEMAFDLEKITVKAKSHAIKAVWGMERTEEDV